MPKSVISPENVKKLIYLVRRDGVLYDPRSRLRHDADLIHNRPTWCSIAKMMGIKGKDGKYVKKIAATGASVPISIPDGASFNDSGAEKGLLNSMDETQTVKFACVGAIYSDPILILTFNKTVGYFNPAMVDVNKGKLGDMLKVPHNLKDELSSFPTYPRIDPYTLELEYYIDKKFIKDK